MFLQLQIWGVSSRDTWSKPAASCDVNKHCFEGNDFCGPDGNKKTPHLFSCEQECVLLSHVTYQRRSVLPHKCYVVVLHHVQEHIMWAYHKGKYIHI